MDCENRVHLNSVRSREGMLKPLAMLSLMVATVVISMSGSVLIGETSSFLTKHEQVEIFSAYASRLGDGGWVIEIQIRNTGSVDATLDLLSINGKGVYAFAPGAVNVTPSFPFSLQAGSGTADVTISVRTGTAGFTSGATVDVELQSSSGIRYPRTVMLL